MKKTAIIALIFIFLLGLGGCGQQVVNQEDYGYYAVREEMPVLTQDSGRPNWSSQTIHDNAGFP